MKEGRGGAIIRRHQCLSFSLEPREDRGLRHFAGVCETHAGERLGVLVDVCEATHEPLTLVRLVPLTHDELDEFAHPRGEGTGRIRCGNDELAHGVHRLALLGGEEGPHRSSRRTRSEQRSQLSWLDASQGGARAHETQELTPIHTSSLRTRARDSGSIRRTGYGNVDEALLVRQGNGRTDARMSVCYVGV